MAMVMTVLATSTGRATLVRERDPRLPVLSCAGLAGLSIPDAIITGAADVAATGPTPAYCRVLATTAPQTDVELRLPQRWQQRLLHLGGSGLDGVIPNLNLNGPDLARGYALAASNGGHRDPTGADLLDPVLAQDYAYAAIGKTVRFAKAVIQFYYGEDPSYSYFAGCSNGGRGAFNAAAKYPDEYDGVIATSPGRNVPGLVSGWVRAALLPRPSPAKMATMYAAELAQCDVLDGLTDGIISNPAACHFDVEALRCPGDVDGSSCLTDIEIQAVNTIRSDVELIGGPTVYSRLGLGNPSTGFGVFQPLGPPGAPSVASFGAAYLKLFVYRDPAYDPATYDVDLDYRTVVDVLEGEYDFSADTKQLARYLRAGKKIIVSHGTEDMALSHIDSIRSYARMIVGAGHDRENARLYTPPGVQHCGNGPGADRVDFVQALSDWVENDRAPGTLVASKVDRQGNVTFTRPLCRYPEYPRYDGIGDPRNAASFTCVLPSGHHRDRNAGWVASKEGR
jgi:pimeloyl-ACP methyl ester carboxylesterase